MCYPLYGLYEALMQHAHPDEDLPLAKIIKDTQEEF